MKVVSTEALTKLIQLIKNSFISVNDTEQTSEIETETPSEITLATVATTGDYDDLINTPDLTLKADVDLSNINPSASAKEEIIGWGMPDYTAGVTVTTPFTPTKDGVLVCIYSITSYLGTVKISTGSTDLAAYKNQSSGSGGLTSLSAIVCKNQQYTFDTGSLSSAIFYPMKGE